MINNNSKSRRTIRVRRKLAQNIGLPRLSIFRSNQHIWAQIIDDKHGRTLVSANSKTIKEKIKKSEKAFKLGENIAKIALEKNIERVRFDRGPYLYHGRVKSVADGARAGGLKF
jgi:large subunit ribosomal protein L18